MRSLPVRLFFIGFILSILSFSVGYASELGGAAPVNPEFFEYLQRRPFEGLHRSQEGYVLGEVPSPVDLSHIRGEDISIPRGADSGSGQLPATYDLRTYGNVTDIRDQSPYGTCWSFSAMASLESVFKKSVGEVNDFSEAHLAYFAYVDEAADFPAFTAGDPGFGNDPIFDQGGNIWKSTSILSRWTGIVDEANRPYVNTNPWPASSLPKASDPVSKRLENVLFIGSDFDKSTVKNAVMEYGAVSFRVVWTNDAFNASTDSYYNPTGSGGGHALAIIGWDDNYPASNFSAQPPVGGAWLVKNSWGSSWGDNGYFWLSYEDPTIGYPAVFEGVDKSKYGKAYQYDPLGWVSSWGYGSDQAWFANVFVSQGVPSGEEQLKAVSFYVAAPNAPYSVEVYANGSVGDPRSGTRLAYKSGTLAVPGYRTVVLDSPVALPVGTRFSVVVYINTPGYNSPIAIEDIYPGYSDKARAAADQSYISSNGSSWTDMTAASANTNVCLKAFTGSSNIATGKEITAFSLPGQVGVSVINSVDSTVSVAMPYGTDLTNLVPMFSLSDGATATVAGVSQVSGSTYNDFTSPLAYLVKAADGSTQSWTVYVSCQKSSSGGGCSVGFAPASILLLLPITFLRR